MTICVCDLVVSDYMLLCVSFSSKDYLLTALKLLKVTIAENENPTNNYLLCNTEMNKTTKFPIYARARTCA